VIVRGAEIRQLQPLLILEGSYVLAMKDGSDTSLLIRGALVGAGARAFLVLICLLAFFIFDGPRVVVRIVVVYVDEIILTVPDEETVETVVTTIVVLKSISDVEVSNVEIDVIVSDSVEVL
jgi:hypothetical protein